MSNQYLKLRRSAVPGKVPDTASIDFGEIALNTHDGLAYMKITGSFGEKVVVIGASGSFTGSLFGTASWAYNAVTASYALNASTANVSGTQYYVAVFSGSDSVVTGSIYDSGSFTAIGATVTPHLNAPERLFVDASDTESYNLISGHGTINNYLQLNVKNFSSGISASSDIVATADNGDEFSYYIDMGVNSAGYNIPDGIGQSNDAYLYSTAQDLLIGNASSGKRVIIFNGSGPALDNARIYINSQGTVGVNASNPSLINPEALLVEPLSTGSSNPAADFSNLIIGRGTINESYLQLNIINQGTGSYASADIVASNDESTETSNYIDMGINASTHIFDPSFAPGTGSDTYVLSTGKDLLIGSATSGSLVFWTNTDFDNVTGAKLVLNYDNKHELTGSLNATQGFTGSLFGTASWAQNSLTASYGGNFTASNLLVTDTITAQTLIVQTITSSIVYSSGSNAFGNSLTNTQVFTGSVSITGSLTVNGSSAILSSQTSSMTVLSASYAATTSYASNAVSSSYPITVTGSTLYSTSPAAGIPRLYSVDHSIFFGQESGYSASSADRSIFLGYRAGYSASTANYSNFFGSRAGAEATNAYYSNFFGEYAGYSASQAFSSNFIGNQAGNEAVYAKNSNFLGYQAGFVATNAFNSNFFGEEAGFYATYADRSNFIGLRAGENATYAQYSNFFGDSAGYGATDAVASNFMGSFAGYTANNSQRSNFIGDNAGNNATDAPFSNFIGYQAGAGAYNAKKSVFIGSNPGYNAFNASHSVFIGDETGHGATLAAFSVFLGYNVARSSNIGGNNIIIGTNITLEDNRRDSINLGGLIFATGSYSVTSSIGINPPFSGSANGRVGINQPRPIFNLDVSGSGRYTNGLQVTSSLIAPSITGSLFGTASWAENAVTSSYSNNALSSSYAFTASSAVSASYAFTASSAISSSYALTASYALNASVNTGSLLVTASAVNTTITFTKGDGTTFDVTVSQSGSVSSASYATYAESALSSSYAATSSWAINSISSSYAISASQAESASYALNAISSSYVSGSAAFVTNLTSSNDANINGITVGRGPGSISTNTVIGYQAAKNLTTSPNHVVIGYQAGYNLTVQKFSAGDSVIIGYQAGYNQTASYNNVYVGFGSGYSNQNSINNTFVGNGSGYLTTGKDNTFFGNYAGYTVTTGEGNTIIGSIGGLVGSFQLSTGNYNTILGRLSSITNVSNNIILADGQGNIKYRWDATQNNIYGNLAVTGSVTATLGFTGSLFGTASWAENFVTSSVSSASFASTASYALTASFGGNFTASNALITGTITAQTLVVSTVSSSVVYSSGSNIFGNSLTNTQVFTGSVSVTGSLTVNGNSAITSNQTSSMSVLSSSFAISASLAQTASYVLNAVSSSYAFTASSAISSSFATTASYVLNAVSSSFSTLAATASYANSGFDIGISEFQTTSSITVAGTTIVSSINTGSFTSAFYNYTIASGSNARSGQVMSVWQGSTVRYTEVTTTDIGNTATASFAVTLSGAAVRLSFSAPGVWTVKSIANLL